MPNPNIPKSHLSSLLSHTLTLPSKKPLGHLVILFTPTVKFCGESAIRPLAYLIPCAFVVHDMVVFILSMPSLRSSTCPPIFGLKFFRLTKDIFPELTTRDEPFAREVILPNAERLVQAGKVWLEISRGIAMFHVGSKLTCSELAHLLAFSIEFMRNVPVFAFDELTGTSISSRREGAGDAPASEETGRA